MLVMVRICGCAVMAFVSCVAGILGQISDRAVCLLAAIGPFCQSVAATGSTIMETVCSLDKAVDEHAIKRSSTEFG